MAGNAFKTNMVWWNLYTFNKKKRRLKKTFPHKKVCIFSFKGVLISSKQHKKSWVQHVKADGNSHIRRLLK